MLHTSLIKLFLLIFIYTVTINNCKSQYFPEITPFSLSLKNNDHNSDGFLVTLKNGRILHFFRIDPGLNGGHIGNAGKIVKRYSDNNGTTWSDPELVYNDQWDNRNIYGGIIGNDTIVLTFLSFDAFENTYKGYYIMYSFDGGNLWTQPQEINTQGKSSGTNKIFFIPNHGYYNSIYDKNYLELRFSPNGLIWDSIVKVWDFRESHQFNVSEASFTSLNNDTIIGLIRNDSNVIGQTLLQVVSFNAGATWSQIQNTNIADSFPCPSPRIFYDTAHKDIWVIVNDRRGELDTGLSHLDEQLWIYKNKSYEIFNNSLGYSLFSKYLRPNPNTKRFFGYPVSSKKNNGNYIVIFNESQYRGGNIGEWAYFYQFDINYQSDGIPIINNKLEQAFNLYPNPAQDFINIEIYKNINFTNLIVINSIGEIVYCKPLDSGDFNFDKFQINCRKFSKGIYNCILNTSEGPFSKLFEIK